MRMDNEYTLPCVVRDFVEWHQGCPWCAVWVVLPDAGALDRTVAAARQALGAALLPGYARQPHITLAYRGLCAAAPGHPAQEYDRAALQADLRLLQTCAPAPFAVRVQGVGSFTTVPYLAVESVGEGAAAAEVAADGRAPQLLAQLHQALVPPAMLHTVAPDWQYVPHITLGHYAQRLPLAQVLAVLQATALPPHTVPVQQLALVRYATAAVAGPLVVEGVFDLTTRRYQPQAGVLWD